MESKAPLVVFGLGAAASLGAWWLLRGKVCPSSPALPDPESFKHPVGKVSKINVYPVKSCHRIEVDTIECGIRGLTNDRYILYRAVTGSRSDWSPLSEADHLTLTIRPKLILQS